MTERTYLLTDSAVFKKTKEKFGGLSNMAAGFSLNVNDILIPSAEHLYQACRFPDHPEIQMDIINETNPMKAKWIGRKHISLSRSDWDQVCFKVMQWCLEIKLSQNWQTFGYLLASTEDKNIVELTTHPKIWGAVQQGDKLVGVNALGRLLMYIRERYVKTSDYQRCVQPLSIPDFKLLGHQIETICNEHYQDEIRWSLTREVTA
jgi:ribA/ribD-fused uncharacterized protein